MYVVEYATEADGPGLAKVNVRSFQGRQLLGQFFPGASLTRMQEYKAIVGMKHLADPNMHVLKIHDPISGELVTYSRWHLPASFGTSMVTLSDQAALYAKDPLPYAPKPMNEAIFKAFKKLLTDARKRYTREDDIILDLIATLPEYQGRGFGSTVLKWGIEKADATQSRIFLEATPEGVPVYLKHGWKLLEEVTIDFASFGSEGNETFYLMMRDPVPQ
ncbi:Acyl-CoA N-acyltransferase [Penicillium sp. DV-2018c]|nr:Acyl-CoA N-acyltransferase [Penicillium sp. DV-2018c]KAJ5565538.1 Acyl-CoA N-acyltransferase [Penicillium sp. DV-2018c]